MSSAVKLSRRTMLRSLGAAIALPALDVMLPLRLLGKSAPNKTNRMGYFYFPNGIPRGTWHPAKTGRNGSLQALNEWMSPLEAYKQHLIIPSNIWTPKGNGHGAGTATWLTGQGYSRREVNAG